MYSTEIRLFIDCLIGSLAFQFLWFVVPLLAVVFSKRRLGCDSRVSDNHSLRLVVLAPCFNGEETVPAFLECMKRQDYPRELYRVIIIADNCTDSSAARARELGADEVYERNNPNLRGKGYALDEFFADRLRQMPFDRLLLFDIDALVAPDYLRRSASHIFDEPAVLQGSTVSKNPDDSKFTRIGDLIQFVLRLHQYGRSLLGLAPILIGSHGISIDREALVRMGWSTAPKGPDGDDLELGLRSHLHGVSVLYAPDLQVINDLPVNGNAIRLQRRRWTRSVLRLAPSYIGAMMRRGLSGDWKAWDVLIGVLLLPSFSNFFLALTATAMGLGAAAIPYAWLRLEAVLAATLWALYAAYLLTALRVSGARIRVSDAIRVLSYLAIRAIALVESFLFVRSKEWWPTSHPSDKEQPATQVAAKEVQP